MTSTKRSPAARPSSSMVVTKAALRAATQLGMTNRALANFYAAEEPHAAVAEIVF